MCFRDPWPGPFGKSFILKSWEEVRPMVWVEGCSSDKECFISWCQQQGVLESVPGLLWGLLHLHNNISSKQNIENNIHIQNEYYSKIVLLIQYDNFDFTLTFWNKIISLDGIWFNKINEYVFCFAFCISQAIN